LLGEFIFGLWRWPDEILTREEGWKMAKQWIRAGKGRDPFSPRPCRERVEGLVFVTTLMLLAYSSLEMAF
jgi:hypothetical protein